ncbi:MAG: STAS/SEC14 domain-containing protein [Flavobacteriales bacterium]
MTERDRTHDTILLDEPFLRMSHAAHDQLIHLEWKGHARSEEYRRGLDLGLAFVMTHEVRYWLADLRTMSAILQVDEKWANEVWFPKLFHTGLEKMAILRSSDYFNQTSVQRSFTAMNGKLTFKVAWFPTTGEAMDWLYTQEAVSA